MFVVAIFESYIFSDISDPDDGSGHGVGVPDGGRSQPASSRQRQASACMGAQSAAAAMLSYSLAARNTQRNATVENSQK